MNSALRSWDYHQESELGHGNFSKVHRAVHRLTGVAYAVKTNRHPITTLQARNMWLNVSSILRRKGFLASLRMERWCRERRTDTATGTRCISPIAPLDTVHMRWTKCRRCKLSLPCSSIHT